MIDVRNDVASVPTFKNVVTCWVTERALWTQVEEKLSKEDKENYEAAKKEYNEEMQENESWGPMHGRCPGQVACQCRRIVEEWKVLTPGV